MTDPVIPNAGDAIGAGIDALVALRPNALAHVDEGNYANVFTGWKSQQAPLIARLADEVRQTRLPTAFGEGLRQLVASEFDVLVSTDGRAPAVGTVTINRSGGASTGTVKRGIKLRRLPNQNLSPALLEATYDVAEDTYMPTGLTVIPLPLRCTQPGTAGNYAPDDATFTNTIPIGQQFQFTDPVFDPALASGIAAANLGGGADATNDDDLRRAAKAMAVGRYAPILGALVAFAYRGFGVRRAAIFEDPVSAISRLVIADGSRYGSARWASQVKQALYDTAVGFGCRISVTTAVPVWLAVTATITLRDSNYQSYTSDISANVITALTRYFSNRDDWYAFKTPAIRGVIGRSDPRILTCTSATVTTANGTPVSDTTPYVPGIGVDPPNFFWTLANNGLRPTYVNPV